MKKVLALIPARGGSKRLPRKNALPLGGKPLIAWSIDVARSCGVDMDILVSTDDAEIAQIAREHGADVPFLRPEHLASDTASSLDVALHALGHQLERGRDYDWLLLLQPTSPFRQASDIQGAFKKLAVPGVQAVISVCPVDHSPLWSNQLPPDGSMDDFLRPEVKGKRSQDLPKFYRLNGAIYLCSTALLRREKTFFPSQGAHALLMDKQTSIDIDDAFDFRIAEALLQITGGNLNGT